MLKKRVPKESTLAPGRQDNFLHLLPHQVQWAKEVDFKPRCNLTLAEWDLFLECGRRDERIKDLADHRSASFQQ